MVTVKLGYDLRTSLVDKVESAGKFGWTAYVNKKGTLVHMVKAGTELLVRLMPRPTLAGVNESYAEKIIWGMVSDHLR